MKTNEVRAPSHTSLVRGKVLNRTHFINCIEQIVATHKEGIAAMGKQFSPRLLNCKIWDQGLADVYIPKARLNYKLLNKFECLDFCSQREL